MRTSGLGSDRKGAFAGSIWGLLIIDVNSQQMEVRIVWSSYGPASLRGASTHFVISALSRSEDVRMTAGCVEVFHDGGSSIGHFILCFGLDLLLVHHEEREQTIDCGAKLAVTVVPDVPTETCIKPSTSSKF